MKSMSTYTLQHAPIRAAAVLLQVLVVEMVLRAIGSNRLAVTPYLGKIQSQIHLVELALGRFQALRREVTSIDEGQHVRCDPAVAEMTRGLGRPQVAAHGEDRQQVALGGLLELGHVARRRSEVSREPDPVLDVGEHVQNVPRRHPLGERILERYSGRRNFAGNRLAQHRLSGGGQGHVTTTLGKFVIQMPSGVGEPVAQTASKGCSFLRQASLLAVGGQQLLAFLPGQQLITVIGELLRAGDTEIAGAQLLGKVGEHTDFEVASAHAQTKTIAVALAQELRQRSEANDRSMLSVIHSMRCLSW